MYSYYANNPIIKALTSEQMEAVYRVRQMQYRIEDIKSHAVDMLNTDDLTFAEYKFVCKAAQDLAERYIYKYHDCDQAENDVMVSMIKNYCRDHAQEIVHMKESSFLDIPEWARELDQIDRDCIEQWGFILGRPLANREEYLAIDDEINEMILEWDDPADFFATYPDMKKYRTDPEAKHALNDQIKTASARSARVAKNHTPKRAMTAIREGYGEFQLYPNEDLVGIDLVHGGGQVKVNGVLYELQRPLSMQDAMKLDALPHQPKRYKVDDYSPHRDPYR